MDAFEIGADHDGQMYLSCIYCVFEIEVDNNITLAELTRLANRHVQETTTPNGTPAALHSERKPA